MTDPDAPATPTPSPSAVLARRGLMLGAGAAALVGATRAGARPAAAEPKNLPAGDQAARRTHKITESRTVPPTGASAAVSGYTYRHVSMFDFTPESAAAQRNWSGSGVYTTGAASTLWASVDIPAGARIREIEWYARNAAGVTVKGLGRVWRAGSAYLYDVVADVPIAPNSALGTNRGIVPADSQGPYPLGTKLNLGLYTPTDATVALSGVRVAFSHGAGALGLLPSPVRAYDSRVSGGKLGAGSTRVVTLPSSVVQPGTTGVVANVVALGSTSGGYLKVYSAASGEPAASSLNYTRHGDPIANAVTVAVSSSRQIKITTYAAVHVIVDIIGTIS